MATLIPVSSQDFKAEWDARTLGDAEAIKADPDRFHRAQEAAKKLADEQKKAAAGLQKVADAGKPSELKTTPRSQTIKNTSMSNDLKLANFEKRSR